MGLYKCISSSNQEGLVEGSDSSVRVAISPTLNSTIVRQRAVPRTLAEVTNSQLKLTVHREIAFDGAVNVAEILELAELSMKLGNIVWWVDVRLH